MRLIFRSRCIPPNYQTNLIVNLSALKQPRSCWIRSESAWSNYARTETFVIIRHHTTPCNLLRDTHQISLHYLGGSMKRALGEQQSNATVWNEVEEVVTPESGGQGCRGKHCKWHAHPWASSNRFFWEEDEACSFLHCLPWQVLGEWYASMEV